MIGRDDMPVVFVVMVSCGTSGRGDVGGGGAGAGTDACLRRRREVLLEKRMGHQQVGRAVPEIRINRHTEVKYRRFRCATCP